MYTVFWLAVLVAVLCIEQLAVKVHGVVYSLPLLPLLIGVGAVIFILTLPAV